MMKSKLYNWVDERFKISPLIDFMKHKEVPIHKHSVWYYMGGVALFLFIVQVLSGILLVLYYQADEDSAYESVRFLMTKVEFGWLVRGVHSWSANLMVLFVFVHMFSTYFTRAYRKPRELSWVTGFILLALAMGFGLLFDTPITLALIPSLYLISDDFKRIFMWIGRLFTRGKTSVAERAQPGAEAP